MKLTAAQIAEVRKKARSTQTGSMLVAATVEAESAEHELTELSLYIENESSLYPLKLQILKGLKKKMDKNLYDAAQAKRLWKFWVDQGARKYVQEFATKGEENMIFNEETKRKLVDQLETKYADEIKSGEHNHVEAAIKTLHLALASVDEEATQAELAVVFPDDVEEIKTSWDEESDGTATFDADGASWRVAESDDAAEAIALTRVQEDLEEEPEIFNKDFMRNYITITETDRGVLANEESDNYVENMEDGELIKEAQLEDEFVAAEEAEDSKLQDDLIQQAKESIQEKKYDEIYKELADPLQYFVHDHGLYSEEDLMKADFISIDKAAAAEDCITTDGWAHFLCTYDGNYKTLPSGAVYWRTD